MILLWDQCRIYDPSLGKALCGIRLRSCCKYLTYWLVLHSHAFWVRASLWSPGLMRSPISASKAAGTTSTYHHSCVHWLVHLSIYTLLYSFYDFTMEVFKFPKQGSSSFEPSLLFWSLLLPTSNQWFQKVTSMPLVTNLMMAFQFLVHWIRMWTLLCLCHKSHQSVYIQSQIPFKCK